MASSMVTYMGGSSSGSATVRTSRTGPAVAPRPNPVRYGRLPGSYSLLNAGAHVLTSLAAVAEEHACDKSSETSSP